MKTTMLSTKRGLAILMLLIGAILMFAFLRTDNPLRMDFERLHGLSEKLEGLVLFCGLGLIVATASSHTID